MSEERSGTMTEEVCGPLQICRSLRGAHSAARLYRGVVDEIRTNA